VGRTSCCPLFYRVPRGALAHKQSTESVRQVARIAQKKMHGLCSSASGGHSALFADGGCVKALAAELAEAERMIRADLKAGAL